MLPSGPEMMIVLLIVVLLFGANKLPKLARASGQAMGEFQRGRAEIERELAEGARLGDEVDEAEADAVDAEATTEVETETTSAGVGVTPAK
ncbi:twin-arginine translocase TatA/TatE family subunit [Halobium salinum]|uniref:Twin-arginine translocase TatA/TatE family subunit n=1 Tax=Halobium salinum TaxID=1364940 RepID=A0ABD5P7L6_9EURY|nr:twin-arginine translocase TatA/TatE family subunit [Halobium salinum]